MSASQNELLQAGIKEVLALVAKQHHELRVLENLVASDDMKYITGSVKNEMLRKLIERTVDIDDATRAVIKGVRTIKRARFKDENALATLVINLSNMGLSMDKLAAASLVKSAEEQGAQPQQQPTE